MNVEILVPTDQSYSWCKANIKSVMKDKVHWDKKFLPGVSLLIIQTILNISALPTDV